MIESAEEFCRLRLSDNPVEYRRAANEEAPVHVWKDVIERFPSLRRWVAYNKTVPIEVLEIIVDDPDDAVRWQVASRNKLSPELLDKLASDPKEEIRVRIVNHRSLPPHVLERLEEDPSELIRVAAVTRRQSGQWTG